MSLVTVTIAHCGCDLVILSICIVRTSKCNLAFYLWVQRGVRVTFKQIQCESKSLTNSVVFPVSTAPLQRLRRKEQREMSSIDNFTRNMRCALAVWKCAPIRRATTLKYAALINFH